MAPHASVATMSLGSGPEQRPVGPRLALPVGGGSRTMTLAWPGSHVPWRHGTPRAAGCWPLVPGCSPWARWWSPRGAVRGPAPGS